MVSAGIIGSPKKKSLFKKPMSQHTAQLETSFPVSLAFTDDGAFFREYTVTSED